MTSVTDHRNAKRVKRRAAILLENFLNDNCHQAEMLNYSPGGMYFESDYAPLPGSEICIGIVHSPDGRGPNIYRARVRWRRPLPRDAKYAYGVGVQYAEPVAG